MNNTYCAIAIVAIITPFTCSAQQILKGEDARIFVNQMSQEWEQVIEKNGNCTPPKTSIALCKFPPGRNTEKTEIKTDGNGCVTGEIIDLDQGGCRVGAFCYCGKDS